MNNDLQHHGIKGQKWGVRRFQNKDGDLTPAGRKRYDSTSPKKQTPKKQTPKKQTPKKQTPKKQTPKKQTPKKQTPKKQTPKKQASSAFLKSVGKIAVTSYVNDKVRNGNGEEYVSMFLSGVMSNGKIMKLDDDTQGY